MTTSEWFAFAAVLVGASAQAITGIGFALICAPLLTLAIGGGDGVRLANVLAIALSLMLLRREFRHANLTKAALLLAPASIAIPITGLAIRGMDPSTLTVISGAIVLVAVSALAGGLRIRRLNGRLGAAIAGIVSGAMNVSGGVGGPAVATYAINANWPAQTLRPTLAAYFLGINILCVVTRGIPPARDVLWLGLVIALIAGFALGAKLTHKLNHHTVRNVTLVLAAAGAIAAIAQTTIF